MAVICRATSADLDADIARMFAACLPPLVETYGDLFVLDPLDFEHALKKRIPDFLGLWIAELLDTGVGSRIYPPDLCRYITSTMLILTNRLNAPPDGQRFEQLVILLKHVIRDHAAGVLIGWRPPAETDIFQRKVARERRLASYAELQRMNGQTENLSTVSRRAGVARKGRGSAERWRDGTLPDSSKTARKIETVFRSV
jgi:hypothetical protein